ncbi:MAG: succinyl-diaminopimelate desuccinylase [Candidatus Eremiobacteraeota bacterium]|nr:succinyl-diaminopimelate desuccinylase [Candidatus Eremiobacteraeota bacterium]
MSTSDLARRTLELVSVASVTREERVLADQTQSWAEQHFGADRVRRWRDGVLVLPKGPGPHLALVGHLDTVPPAAGQPTEIRDGRVYGCGASDMKAGVAVMMALLEQYDAVGVFYDREEGPGDENGLVPLLEMAPELDLAIVLEPTNNEVQVGCVGSLHARVTVAGQRAHSARPWQGKNAVYEAVPLLQRLAGLERREVQVQGQTFYEVLTVTQANTANPRNAVPDALVLNLNYRFAPGRDQQSARDQVVQACQGYEVELLDFAPAGAVCLDHPRLAGWIESQGLVVTSKQAWTDVAQLTARGVPAVNFGPGEPAQAHQAGEWAEIAAIEANYRALARLITA